MNPTLSEFLYLGEDQYLSNENLDEYQAYLSQLEKKVRVYEIIRDQEVFLFNIVATELQESYPEERSHIICEAISQWSLILKYACTAMVLDNAEYLVARSENWLKELIKLRSIPKIDEILYQTLIEILPEVLTDEEKGFLTPYLEQVWQAVRGSSESEELLVLG